MLRRARDRLFQRQPDALFPKGRAEGHFRVLGTTADGAAFIPKREDDLQVMLAAYLLDKAVYEVGYELNNRPDWVVIPVRGIKHILQQA